MRNSIKYGLPLVMCGLLLTGCGTVHSRALPDLVPYTPAIQAQAAAELTGGSCPAMAGMVVDYGLVRDQIRALQ